MSATSSSGPQIYRGAVDRGLEGVVACTTRISSIEEATLCYRGYTIEDLAEHSSFEETIFLLWEGRLPTGPELSTFTKELRQEMALSSACQDIVKGFVRNFPKNGHPMDFLRTAVSALSFLDPDVVDLSDAARRRKALRITAKMGTLVATFGRLREGHDFVPPQADKSLAWNFLHMLSGREPTSDHVKIFDTALILHADHEINCSAFSTRVTASSLSDIYSAIVSAIGTLKGPLHGGANEAVMKMLKEIGSVENARSFVEQALAGKQKVMGIGHRVYKNGDPRAKILQKISQRVTREAGHPELYEMSILIDQTMQEKKGLMPNVDFYSATVYNAMGIPTDLFTPIFAVSRVSGWCAHAFEQYANNRIYRPRGEYAGPTQLKWSPLSARGRG